MSLSLSFSLQYIKEPLNVLQEQDCNQIPFTPPFFLELIATKNNDFDHFEGAVTPDQPGLRTFIPITNFAEGVGRSDPSRSQYHRYTANYFLSQSHSDRRCEELPWHLDMCDDMKLLCQVLAEPK